MTGSAMLALGVGTSFVAGFAAIRFLVSYLQRRTLLVFVVYRIALGGAPLLVTRWLRAPGGARPSALRPAPPPRRGRLAP